MQLTPLRPLCGLIAAALIGSLAQAQSVVFTNFDSAAGSLTLNGNAHFSGSPAVLRLTDSAFSQSGSAFSNTKISLTNNSFSTAFSFQISAPAGISDGDGQGADGLTFTIQTVSNTTGGAGGGIGYQGILKSVAVEFDTYDNGEISGNHVAIDTNGNLNNLFATNIPTRMNNGNVWYSWIDYDNTSHLLEVRISQNSTRPVAALIATTTIDVAAILGSNEAYVGFTSGTGSAYGNHDILSWQFNNSFQPINQVGESVPDATSTVTLFGVAMLSMFGLQLRRRK
jgi:hypothetical protein